MLVNKNPVFHVPVHFQIQFMFMLVHTLTNVNTYNFWF